MTDSSSIPVESPTSDEEWFLKEWKDNNDDGLTNYILITANRLQKGKTSLAIRIAELIEEKLGTPFPMEWDPDKPTDFSKSNIGFDPLWYMERMDNVPEHSILIGDEWNRAAGQRQWYTQENQDFAEVLQTTAFQHIHGLFPLPHQALTDNAIVGICTAHIIVETKGLATAYQYDREQLNRGFKQRTPFLGQLFFKTPSTVRWNIYKKMRIAYLTARKKVIVDRRRKMMEAALLDESAPKREDLVETVLAHAQDYIGSKDSVSAIKIAAKHRIPWNRATVVAAEVNEKRKNK